VHGKEGVDGSSPSEGSAKVQHVAAFAFSPTCRVGSVRWVWSRLWSFDARESKEWEPGRIRLLGPSGFAPALHDAFYVVVDLF
jgi:hypothetical protein